MSVPAFQSWLLPLLKRIADGGQHQMSELYQSLADELHLSPQDRAELLSSGKQFTYQNRIGWARTYLKKARLLESPSRGAVQITPRGKDVLVENLPALHVKYLKKFPEFVEFQKITAPSTAGGELSEPTETPEDTLERVSTQLQDDLAAELIEKVKAAPPELFERLVVDLLFRMGYAGSQQDAAKVLGKSGDGGVDGVIKADRLGFEVIYVQAKRWDGVVGRPVVQAFAGSLDGFHAKKGVMITTSSFSQDAQNYVGKIEKKIVLIDGPTFAAYAVEHNLGVSNDKNYEVKRSTSTILMGKGHSSAAHLPAIRWEWLRDALEIARISASS